MYAIVRETDDATAVDFSFYGRFLSGSNAQQLLTISGKTLRLYRPNPWVEPVEGQNLQWGKGVRLECLLSVRLLSRVRSAATARAPCHPASDLILVAFDDAKLSVLAVDADEWRFKTISLHSFEEDDELRGVVGGGLAGNPFPPVVRTDPDGRCAAMLCYGRFLAVFPLLATTATATATLPALQKVGKFATTTSIKSYVLQLNNVDSQVENVSDVCFLDGYYEPTLVILHEPLQSTAGKASVRFDTVAMVGVSLNVVDRQHAVVWRMARLPMDARRLLAVPRPVGGTVVLGANTVLYANQAGPPCAAAVNLNIQEHTKFPLKDLSSLNAILDGVVACALSPHQLLIGAHDRQLFMLTLVIDATHTVKSIDMERVRFVEPTKPPQEGGELPATIAASTACTLTRVGAEHVFLGSRVGDSFFLKYSVEQVAEQNGNAESASSQASEEAQPPKEVALDADDLDLYGESATAMKMLDSAAIASTSHRERIVFDLADRILNLGPIRNVTAASAQKSTNPEEDQQRRLMIDPIFDLVAAIGQGEDGALAVMQRTLRPQVAIAPPLPGALAVWPVGRDDVLRTHRYVLVGKPSSTLVLEVRDDMVELDEPLFVTDEPTVAAGDMMFGMIAVQVTVRHLVAVVDGQQIEKIRPPATSPLSAASIAHDWVGCLSQMGRIFLYHLESEPHLHLRECLAAVDLGATSPTSGSVSAIAIYRDVSGLMRVAEGVATTYEDPEQREERRKALEERIAEDTDDVDKALYGTSTTSNSSKKTTTTAATGAPQQAQVDVDLEDLLLYGGAGAKPAPVVESVAPAAKRAKTEPAVTAERETEQTDEEDAITAGWGVPHPDQIPPTSWLLVARESGELTIHTLPDVERIVFRAARLSAAPEVLVDDGDQLDPSALTATTPMAVRRTSSIATSQGDGDDLDQQQSTTQVPAAPAHRPEDLIAEIALVGMGANASHPALLAIVDDQLLVYELFATATKSLHKPGRLTSRFRRSRVTLPPLRPSPFVATDGSGQRAPLYIGRETERRRQYIQAVERIGSISNAALVGGVAPTLLHCSFAQGLVAHRLQLCGRVKTLTTLHNEALPHSLLYLADDDENLRVAQLQADFDYDHTMPVRKIPVGRTVNFVKYFMQHEVAVVATHEDRRSNRLAQLHGEEKVLEVIEKEPGYVLPVAQQHSISLYAADTWRPIAGTEIPLQEMEVVTALEEALLGSEANLSGLQSFVAVGTCHNFGEEVSIRGRILIGEIIEVVPEPGQPTSRNRLKLLYDKEQKGPVTALCAVQGLLLSGLGSKIFIWRFEDNELNGLSFLDMNFYIHQMVPFRDLILCVDMYRGVSLVRWQQSKKYKALSVVSRDERHPFVPPFAAAYLVDGQQMAFVVTDEQANLCVTAYAPESKEACGGEKLVPRWQIHLGSDVNAMVRVKGHTSTSSLTQLEARLAADRQTLVWFGLDGAIGYVRGISEKVFRRLHFLQQYMHSVVPQAAGLNPRGARAAWPHRAAIAAASQKNGVDAEVVGQFIRLPAAEKQDLARRMGGNRYQILDDLYEVERLATFY